MKQACWMLLLLCSATVAEAVTPRFDNPPAAMVTPPKAAAPAVLRQGTVDSFTRATVKINNVLYLWDAEATPVKADSYPHRELVLEKGMRVRFSAQPTESGGALMLKEVWVLGR